MKASELLETIVIGNMKLTGVYAIFNPLTGKIYIGSTVRSIGQRWREHKHYLRQGNHQNHYLQSSWNKYGEASFSFIILENCSRTETRIRESYYLNLIDQSLIMNISPVEDFFEKSEELKKKLSAIHKGRMPPIKTMEAAWAACKGRKEPEDKKRKRAIAVRAGLLKRFKRGKLNKDQVLEIRIMLDNKVKRKDIMEKFKISRVQIYRIQIRERWGDI